MSYRRLQELCTKFKDVGTNFVYTRSLCEIKSLIDIWIIIRDMGWLVSEIWELVNRRKDEVTCYFIPWEWCLPTFMEKRTAEGTLQSAPPTMSLGSGANNSSRFLISVGLRCNGLSFELEVEFFKRKPCYACMAWNLKRLVGFSTTWKILDSLNGVM